MFAGIIKYHIYKRTRELAQLILESANMSSAYLPTRK